MKDPPNNSPPSNPDPLRQSTPQPLTTQSSQTPPPYPTTPSPAPPSPPAPHPRNFAFSGSQAAAPQGVPHLAEGHVTGSRRFARLKEPSRSIFAANPANPESWVCPKPEVPKNGFSYPLVSSFKTHQKRGTLQKDTLGSRASWDVYTGTTPVIPFSKLTQDLWFLVAEKRGDL